MSEQDCSSSKQTLTVHFNFWKEQAMVMHETKLEHFSQSFPHIYAKIHTVIGGVLPCYDTNQQKAIKRKVNKIAPHLILIKKWHFGEPVFCLEPMK